MDLEQVKQFLNENKDKDDVKAYLGELKQPGEEDVKGFLETDEGKRFMQPRFDSYFNKGLETWKTNNLQKLVDEKVAELNPQETEAERRIKALEQQLEQREKDAKREQLKNKALGVAGEKKLPSKLVPFLLGEDEESTLSNLTVLEEVWSSDLSNLVDERFKQGGRNPKDGKEPDNSAGANFAKSANQQKETPTTDIWGQ